MKEKGILTIKAFAIVGVLLHHAGNRRLDLDVQAWIEFLANCFSWCVLAFFATSGWLQARSEEKSPKGVSEFIATRSRRLLLPYIILILLYSVAWHIIQKCELVDLRGAIPSTFLGKLTTTLLPAGQEVAEQLYFLPLLFVVAVLHYVFWRMSSNVALYLMPATAFAVGIALYPESLNVGLSLGLLVWGAFSYSGGFVIYRLRHKHGLLSSFLIAGAALLATLVGFEALAKCFPLFLLLGVPLLRLPSWSTIPAIGEASGTVYVYHSPFLLHPLMIAVSRLPSPRLQYTAALSSVGLVVVVCCIVYFRLKDTRWRFALM